MQQFGLCFTKFYFNKEKNDEKIGCTRVYDYNTSSNQWELKFETCHEQFEIAYGYNYGNNYYLFGSAVAMNGLGNTFIAGGAGELASENGEDGGLVKVYSLF